MAPHTSPSSPTTLCLTESPPLLRSLLAWLVLQLLPPPTSGLFLYPRPLQVRGYPSPTRRVRGFLFPTVSPFAGSGQPESYKTRARSPFSSCLTLCRFGAARVLQDACEISFPVQCGFGATRCPPENSFFRPWIDTLYATMLLFMRIHLFSVDACLSQISPVHMRQYTLIHQHPPQPTAVHCSGLIDVCGVH